MESKDKESDYEILYKRNTLFNRLLLILLIMVLVIQLVPTIFKIEKSETIGAKFIQLDSNNWIEKYDANEQGKIINYVCDDKVNIADYLNWDNTIFFTLKDHKMAGRCIIIKKINRYNIRI